VDSNSEIQEYNVYPMLHFHRKFSSSVTAIVLDQPERTIFLFNEEHRGCYGGFGRLDLYSTQVFL